MQSTRSTALARTLRGVCRSPSYTAQRCYTSRAVIPARQQQKHHQQRSTPSLQPQHNRLVTLRTQTQTQTQTRHTSSSSTPASASLQKTPLYDLHLAHGAKMVPFGGFHMPVQYTSQSVGESHLFTRSHASIFDVSHMVQRVFSGPGAARFLERITPAGVEALAEHRSTLACSLNEAGGIVDDAIITRLREGRFYVVTNAACREKDDKFLAEEMEKWRREENGAEMEVKHEKMEDHGLVALQGPEAEGILGQVLADGEGLELKKLLFGQSAFARIKLPKKEVSSPVLISRGGYTGEDGFEVSVPADETVDVTEALLAAGGPGKVQLAGLGARDSLRLEAGMCLYGNDMDESTTPVEAGLSWIIPKARRSPETVFNGASVILQQLKSKSSGGTGVERRRVGLIVEGAPAREGVKIVSRDGQADTVELGTVTSGCPSPSLGKNIAMGYVKDGFHKAGTEVSVMVRGRTRNAVITKMPFVPTKYWKGEA